MDPNLDKIIKHNLRDIKKGSLGTAINQGKDYLNHIYSQAAEFTEETRTAKNKEMDDFADHVRSLAPQEVIRPLSDLARSNRVK